MIKHRQIIDKIGFEHLAQAIDEDLARLFNYAMRFKKGGSIDDVSSYILPLILARWDCVLLAENGLAKYYKEKVFLMLAILLHKYGLSENRITEEAIKSITILNDNMVLGEDFFRKSQEIKKLLKTKPLELRRKPRKPQNITFFRANDIISIKIDGKYYIAYIHKLTGVNEAAVIEFYDEVFEKIPKIKELTNMKAKGERFNDGKIRIAKFAIYGMKHQPDLANQIHLIGSSTKTNIVPDNKHLEESIGLFTVSNLFFIQKTIREMFKTEV